MFKDSNILKAIILSTGGWMISSVLGFGVIFTYIWDGPHVYWWITLSNWTQFFMMFSPYGLAYALFLKILGQDMLDQLLPSIIILLSIAGVAGFLAFSS